MISTDISHSAPDRAALVRPSPLDLAPEAMRAAAELVSRHVIAHVASLREQPAQQSMTPQAARSSIAGPAPERGETMDVVLADLEQRVFPYHAREPHPRFLGYVPSCPTFPGVLGDFIGASYNFFSGVWSVAAGPNQVELTVLDWFRTWLGMPEGTSGLLVSGGSSATLTAIVAARHHAVGANSDRLPKLTLYTSDQAHSSVARAAWIAGISRDNVRAIPTDDGYRMRIDALRDALTSDRQRGLLPFCVCASAGTTNTGAVDPMHEVSEVCRSQDLWMHVDAAYAGFAALTARGRNALAGIEQADSVTLDPHKWLFVPFECGCLLAREPRRLEETFSVHPEYLADVAAREHEVNFADYGEQLTRGPRAMKIWVSVRHFGVAAIREAIERGMRMAEYAEWVARIKGLEILTPAQFGVLCFRSPARSGESADQTNARNTRLNARVNATGRFLMSSTVLRGTYSLRICTHSFRTTADDIDALMDATLEAASTE